MERRTAALPVNRVTAAGLTAGASLDAKGVRELNQAADEESGLAYSAPSPGAALLRGRGAAPHCWCGRASQAMPWGRARPGTAIRVCSMTPHSLPGSSRPAPNGGAGRSGFDGTCFSTGVDGAVIERALSVALPPDHDPQLAAERPLGSASRNPRLAVLRPSSVGSRPIWSAAGLQESRVPRWCGASCVSRSSRRPSAVSRQPSAVRHKPYAHRP